MQRTHRGTCHPCRKDSPIKFPRLSLASCRQFPKHFARVPKHQKKSIPEAGPGFDLQELRGAMADMADLTLHAVMAFTGKELPPMQAQRNHCALRTNSRRAMGTERECTHFPWTINNAGTSALALQGLPPRLLTSAPPEGSGGRREQRTRAELFLSQTTH